MTKMIFNVPSGSLYLICPIIPNQSIMDETKYKIVEYEDTEVKRGHVYTYDFATNTVIDEGMFTPNIAEVQRMESERTAVLYKQQRAEQYPSIGDQLDMLWHSMDNGTLPQAEPFYSAIKSVKDSNPKPNI